MRYGQKVKPILSLGCRKKIEKEATLDHLLALLQENEKLRDKQQAFALMNLFLEGMFKAKLLEALGEANFETLKYMEEESEPDLLRAVFQKEEELSKEQACLRLWEGYK